MTLERVIEIAGAVGALNFKDLTIYELLNLYKGKRAEKWGEISPLLALIHNAHSKHPKSPLDFNPTLEKEKPRAVESIFNLL